jgi:hypothetical protein
VRGRENGVGDDLGGAMSDQIKRPETTYTATNDAMELVRLGIEAAKAERYRDGLDYLAEAYVLLTRRVEVKSTEALSGAQTSATIKDVVPASALSYYGLCLAMHNKNFTEASTFCELAIRNERFVGEHYLNLARVWRFAHNRRKMAEAIDRGMKVSPNWAPLQRFADEVGFRKDPVFGFLPRESVLNKALGKLRHRMQGTSSKEGDAGAPVRPAATKRKVTRSRIRKGSKG